MINFYPLSLPPPRALRWGKGSFFVCFLQVSHAYLQKPLFFSLSPAETLGRGSREEVI